MSRGPTPTNDLALGGPTTRVALVGALGWLVRAAHSGQLPSINSCIMEWAVVCRFGSLRCLLQRFPFPFSLRIQDLVILDPGEVFLVHCFLSATNLEGKMASNFVSKEDHHQRHQAPSRRGVRGIWSSNSSTCGQGAAAAAVPKCVCAPATHAGSFKCRLHRASSHGHSPPSPTSIRPPPPPSSSSRAPTVEAQ
ncbi:hypothetical protein MUK42_15208 [Musa troglodytarum]|uniref:Uncharacterized protein n=1 Tax=Musa troglodytarum TaxID=320322 RepID=A0A9E7HYM0_9LILI|nr:hypothetical protein MUK42_15208 [Musa troglodytarum]